MSNTDGVNCRHRCCHFEVSLSHSKRDENRVMAGHSGQLPQQLDDATAYGLEAPILVIVGLLHVGTAVHDLCGVEGREEKRREMNKLK